MFNVWCLMCCVYLKLGFFFVYRPMLGKNSKHESLPSIGCLSWFMFYMRKKYHRKTVCISQKTSLSCPIDLSGVPIFIEV